MPSTIHKYSFPPFMLQIQTIPCREWGWKLHYIATLQSEEGRLVLHVFEVTM